jgi:hypothetical protein
MKKRRFVNRCFNSVTNHSGKTRTLAMDYESKKKKFKTQVTNEKKFTVPTGYNEKREMQITDG